MGVPQKAAVVLTCEELLYVILFLLVKLSISHQRVKLNLTVTS